MTAIIDLFIKLGCRCCRFGSVGSFHSKISTIQITSEIVISLDYIEQLHNFLFKTGNHDFTQYIIASNAFSNVSCRLYCCTNKNCHAC